MPASNLLFRPGQKSTSLLPVPAFPSPAGGSGSGGVPQIPVTVLPRSNGSRIPQSPANHSYDAGMGPGLAGRAVRPVGRSGYDLNRIAEQEFRRSGNPAMLLQMDWRNRMDANNAPSQPQFGPAGGTPPPTMPTRPGGRLVPGSRPGSSIWVSDPPATMEPPQRPGAAAPGGPPEIPPPASEGLAPPTMPPRGMPGTFGPPQLPWEQPMPAPPTRPGYLGNFLPDPNKGAFDPSAPLPPSPLANYTPPPPMVGSIPIPQTNGRMVLTNGKPTGQTFTESKPDPEPFIPTPEQVRAHNLQPDFSKTTVYNGQHYPTWKSGKPQASTIKVLNDQRQPVDFPAGYELPPGWTELKPKGAGASAPAASAKAAPGKTKSGFTWKTVEPKL